MENKENEKPHIRVRLYPIIALISGLTKNHLIFYSFIDEGVVRAYFFDKTCIQTFFIYVLSQFNIEARGVLIQWQIVLM